jgi:hypothetical protein
MDTHTRQRRKCPAVTMADGTVVRLGSVEAFREVERLHKDVFAEMHGDHHAHVDTARAATGHPWDNGFLGVSVELSYRLKEGWHVQHGRSGADPSRT